MHWKDYLIIILLIIILFLLIEALGLADPFIDYFELVP
jgi:hypothetical protein